MDGPVGKVERRRVRRPFGNFYFRPYALIAFNASSSFLLLPFSLLSFPRERERERERERVFHEKVEKLPGEFSSCNFVVAVRMSDRGKKGYILPENSCNVVRE